MLQSAGAASTDSTIDILKDDFVFIEREMISDYVEVESSGGHQPIPNIFILARWMLGSLIYFAMPFYKQAVSIEDGVEKTVKSVVKVVEIAAEVTEKVAFDVANALPDNSRLKQEILEVEQFAEVVDKDAKKAENFIQKADQMEDEIDTFVEHITNEEEQTEKESLDEIEEVKTFVKHIIEEGENIVGEETQQKSKEKKENSPSSELPKTL